MKFTTPPQLSIFFYIDSVPFTRDVLEKRTSLGGSESAGRTLAEALAARGHDVHIFATKVETPGEYFGVFWHEAEAELPDVLRFTTPDVFISLRMPQVFCLDIPAKLRILWAQDLLINEALNGQLFSIDWLLCVSEYHRKQWCDKAEMFRPVARVIKNPIDPSDLVRAGIGEVVRQPRSFIHVSRPERGMDALLALWPRIRGAYPDATLSLCRYNSMYDAGGWGKICEAYDRMVEHVNQRVGGITYLGELNKPQLYAAIAAHQFMLYPTSQDNFAETNCVAATEAQACGTLFLGSWRGALPETVHPDAGVLIEGDARTVDVQDAYLAAIAALEGDAEQVARKQEAGYAHAAAAYGDVVAADFEGDVLAFFEDRYNANKIGVLRQCLHWDNHAPGLVVAQDILDTMVRRGQIAEGVELVVPHVPAEAVEAFESLGLCRRVIAQEEQTAAHYAQFAIQDPRLEAEQNQRLQLAADHVAADNPTTILDVACGNGAMALILARKLPGARIIGIDYSAGVLELARRAAEEEGVADRVTFVHISGTGPLPSHRFKFASEAPNGFDAVFCGEFMEHVEKPWQLLDELEMLAAPNGRIVLTTPCGPFAELLDFGIPRQRGHVHAFTHRDLSAMGAGKREWQWQYAGIGVSPRGTACGYWILGFRPGGAPAAPLDYTHTILTERPYQTVHAAMIVRDGEAWLRKCVESYRSVVDKIVVVDTGSRDGTVELARALGCEVTETEWPEDFSVARNISLDLAGPGADWIFWIDADEQLEGAMSMRRYTVDGGLFKGYAIHQHHLMIDAPNFEDRPVRLFRAREGYRFYGVVHEQPESAPDKAIVPALDQVDMKIVHLGYHLNHVRRRKMLDRNLPLLMKEVEGRGTHPPRDLAWVLYIRDCVNIALFQKEDHRRMTRKGLLHVKEAVRVYRAKGFDDPAHSCHRIAFPYYQQALELTGKAIQVAWTFGAGQGGLQATPRIGTYWAADADEAERIAVGRVKTWCDTFRTTVDVVPAAGPKDRSRYAWGIEPRVEVPA